MADSQASTSVVTRYHDFNPPIDAAFAARTLLQYVEPAHLAGLQRIVLTNSGALNRQRRRKGARLRGRRVPVDRVLGLYHRKTEHEGAWIEIFVDHISAYQAWPGRRIPFFRLEALASVLYHEIGHHIHATSEPEHTEPEEIAEKWQRRLTQTCLRRRYWYLIPAFWVLKIVLSALRIIRSRNGRTELTPRVGAWVTRRVRRQSGQ